MLEDKIPVQIFGQSYEILGSASETLYYSSLARFVEDKMKEILQHTNVVSTQKVAVLAALNIADELFRDRENKTLGGKTVDRKVEELLKKLEAAVREPGSPSPMSSPQHQPLKTRQPAVHHEHMVPQELELI